MTGFRVDHPRKLLLIVNASVAATVGFGMGYSRAFTQYHLGMTLGGRPQRS